MSDWALRAERVSKGFRIGGDRPRELKEALLHPGRRAGRLAWAIRDVDLAAPSATRVGVIGGNGAGKTTLLRCLAGVLRPDRGHVRVRRRRLISLLQLGTGFHPDLTGRDNVFLNASLHAVRRRECRAMLDEIVDFAGVEGVLDRRLRTYSAGMQLRLGLAIALHIAPDVLIVDEVYSIGDSAFRLRTGRRILQLVREGTTLVLATHDLVSAVEDCDSLLYLRGGRVAGLGSPRSVVEQYVRDAAGGP